MLLSVRRPLQREAINATLQGRDALCLMPTGEDPPRCSLHHWAYQSLPTLLQLLSHAGALLYNFLPGSAELLKLTALCRRGQEPHLPVCSSRQGRPHCSRQPTALTHSGSGRSCMKAHSSPVLPEMALQSLLEPSTANVMAQALLHVAGCSWLAHRNTARPMQCIPGVRAPH